MFNMQKVKDRVHTARTRPNLYGEHIFVLFLFLSLSVSCSFPSEDVSIDDVVD